MSTSLHTNLSALASSFADQILDVLRGVSLDELLGEAGAGRSAPRAQRPEASPKSGRASASERLQRRSGDDIAKALDKVHGLLKSNKGGLRAEQIRSELGMQAKEMPRVLKQGLAMKRLTSKGQKRATTYFAK